MHQETERTFQEALPITAEGKNLATTKRPPPAERINGLHHGIVHSREKERITATEMTASEPQECNAEDKTSCRKRLNRTIPFM